MKSIQELQAQSNQANVNLLFTDAEMALTFLDLARTSQDEKLKLRRMHEAGKAYTFIQRRIPTLRLTPDETIALNKKMALLKLRLTLA